jgi:DNA mismatch repair protein MutS
VLHSKETFGELQNYQPTLRYARQTLKRCAPEGTFPGAAMNEEAVAPPVQRERPAVFQSILFGPGADEPIRREAPDFFGDLNLDQIVAAAIAKREEYDLQPFFHTSLRRVCDVDYRYEILQDLQNPCILACVRAFAQEMRTMRSYLAQGEKHYYRPQKQSAFIDAVSCYCAAAVRFAEDLAKASPSSDGLSSFLIFLTEYVNSSDFGSIVSETEKVKSDLAGVRYRLLIQGKRITVTQVEDELDYRADVLATFQKFKEGANKEIRFDHRFLVEMNHVEAEILDLVAQLFPEVFAYLDEYTVRRAGFTDATIARFDREVQFYIACIEFVEPMKRAGLSFCFPTVSDQSKQIQATETFDLALAIRLVQGKVAVVTNDLCLAGPERVFVVTGPNQGGKTTFARTVGQLHYLASIGFPIPGRDARLFLFDKLFTHFEREEDLRNLSGKLEDELLRIRAILAEATPNSILIMNESFLSTTLNDAIFLSKEVMRKIIALDLICVSVTFLDELASFSDSTVSMVSTVNPSDPAQRTFKVVRRPADGLAYAAALAEKYKLAYESVKARIANNNQKRVAS